MTAVDTIPRHDHRPAPTSRTAARAAASRVGEPKANVDQRVGALPMPSLAAWAVVAAQTRRPSRAGLAARRRPFDRPKDGARRAFIRPVHPLKAPGLPGTMSMDVQPRKSSQPSRRPNVGLPVSKLGTSRVRISISGLGATLYFSPPDRKRPCVTHVCGPKASFPCL